jgi:hypothetical protein
MFGPGGVLVGGRDTFRAPEFEYWRHCGGTGYWRHCGGTDEIMRKVSELLIRPDFRSNPFFST